MNIFQQYMQPVKSVAEYDEEYAKRDQNKLARLLQQQQFKQTQMGMERQNKLAALLQGMPNATDDQRINALKGGGYFDEADKVQKSMLERDKTKSETAARDIATRKAKIELLGSSSKFVLDNPTPEAAKAWAQFAVENELIPPEKGRELMAAIPTYTPDQIKNGALQMFQAALAAEKQLPKIETRDLGGTSETTAIDPITLKTKTVNSAAKTQSPDNMVDARARERLALDSGAAVADAGGPNQAPLVKRFGKPPPGYRWKADGSGDSEAIPGGPADIKAGEKGEKDKMRQLVLTEQANSVLGEISDAKKLTGWSTAGPAGLLAKLPMTDARKLSGHVDTIKANLGFDRLQQMRDMSPTGGALGQVAVKEINYLQSTVSKLDQLQDPRDVAKALDKIETHYNNWKKTLGGEPDKPAAPPPGAPPAFSDAEKERRYQEWKAKQGGKK